MRGTSVSEEKSPGGFSKDSVMCIVLGQVPHSEPDSHRFGDSTSQVSVNCMVVSGYIGSMRVMF